MAKYQACCYPRTPICLYWRSKFNYLTCTVKYHSSSRHRIAHVLFGTRAIRALTTRDISQYALDNVRIYHMPVCMRMTLVTMVTSQWTWIASTTASCSLFCTPISIAAFLTMVFMSQQLFCWSYLSLQVPTWLRVVLDHKMIQPDSTVAAPRTITLARFTMFITEYILQF